MTRPNIPALATTRANATPQQDTHPAEHNALASFVNEGVNRVVWLFATETERDTDWPNPTDAALCMTLDTRTLWTYASGGWRAVWAYNATDDRTAINALEVSTIDQLGSAAAVFAVASGGTTAVRGLNAIEDIKTTRGDFATNLAFGTGYSSSTERYVTVQGGWLKAGTAVSSLAALKRDVADVDLADVALALRPRSFVWREDHEPGIGLVAEEVEAVDPRLARYTWAAPSPPVPTGEVDDDAHRAAVEAYEQAVDEVNERALSPDHHPDQLAGISWDHVTTALVSLCQRQQSQIDDLTAKVAALGA